MIKKLKLAIGNLGIRLIKFTSRKAKIDLIRVAYAENGLTKSHSLKASGELYFIKTFLQQQIKNTQPILLDVGGNIGEYSLLLRKNFPNAQIYTFEPNPTTFRLLKDKIGEASQLIQKGIGSDEGELELFFDANNPSSVQATSNREILDVIAKTETITSEKIQITTLDHFCEMQKIERIDLLKIDTEGFEYEALIGAKKLLENNQINCIQFEFNEVNIVKRRFLRDFYLLLPQFNFYRLDEKRLIPLGEWQPIHEIFMFQNIVAIRK